jgi:hypothetical protein
MNQQAHQRSTNDTSNECPEHRKAVLGGFPETVHHVIVLMDIHAQMGLNMHRHSAPNSVEIQRFRRRDMGRWRR